MDKVAHDKVLHLIRLLFYSITKPHLSTTIGFNKTHDKIGYNKAATIYSLTRVNLIKPFIVNDAPLRVS